MSVTITSARVPNTLKIRQALALPLYSIALVLIFVGEGIGKLSAIIADDPY